MSSTLDEKYIKSISRQIHQRFPEVAGIQPKIRLQRLEGSQDKDHANYLLTFSGKAQIAGDRQMERTVRVVVNNQGKILKITTSR